MTDDERQIRNLVESWMAASKAGDLPALLELMTDDVVFMVPGREPFGKAEFAAGSESKRGASSRRPCRNQGDRDFRPARHDTEPHRSRADGSRRFAAAPVGICDERAAQGSRRAMAARARRQPGDAGHNAASGGTAKETIGDGPKTVACGRRLFRADDRRLPIGRWNRRSSSTPPPACRRSTCRRRTASCSICWRVWPARAKALEIGALGGYSAIWIARALPPDGRLVTLEADERHAKVAAENIARAGLSEKVEIRVGPALGNLPKIEAEGMAPFDFVFIDADKSNNDKLSRVGAAPVAARYRDRRRQRGPRRRDRRSRAARSRRRRDAADVRDDGARAAPRGDGDPDGRRQGLGRICAGDCRVRRELGPRPLSISAACRRRSRAAENRGRASFASKHLAARRDYRRTSRFWRERHSFA